MITETGSRLVLAAAAACLALLVLPPGAMATQYVSKIVAGSSTAGQGEGEFSQPRGIAINDPGVNDGSPDPLGASTDGYIYVADGGNHRVQVFDAAGNFVFMFGNGVLSGNGAAHEVCDTGQAPCGNPAPQAGSGSGSFSTPQGVGINQATGDLYIRDRTNHRVSQYTAAGEFLRSWGWGVDDGTNEFQICEAPADLPCQAGIAGAEGGQFGNTDNTPDGSGIVVQPEAPHQVYVADPTNQRIHEYGADGAFVRLWGWNVVKTGQPGNVGGDFLPLTGETFPLGVPIGETNFEVCATTDPGVCQAGAIHPTEFPGNTNSGRAPGKFAPRTPLDLAVGLNGTLYASSASNRIHRFDLGTGAPQDWFSASYHQSSVSLAVQPHTGDVLVSEAIGEIVQFDTDVDPRVEVDRHLVGAGVVPDGMVVQPVSGALYFPSGNRILEATEEGAQPPPGLAIADPSSTVVGTSVTLSGTVTPNGPPGIPTTYNFQHSHDGGESWTTVPGSANPLGDGADPVPVTDAVAGLEPNSEYSVRIAARKAFGNPDHFSAEQHFTTDPVPPDVETVYPLARGATSAVLAGIVNPNNSMTTYRFEWGKDASYGNAVPVPDGIAGSDFGERAVTAEIGGLTPGVEYHYRLVADNGVEASAGETVVSGDDIAFVTREAGSPGAARNYEMVTPPFKVVRTAGGFSARTRNNPNVGVPSLDGSAFTWMVPFFPLTDEVGAPAEGDKLLFRRGRHGWVGTSRNSLSLRGSSHLIRSKAMASSGDLATLTWALAAGADSELLPSEGNMVNRLYTRRDGTGTKGFTAWLENPEVATDGFTDQSATSRPSGDRALFNDAGTALARWGHYRGLAEPSDPSRSQQLSGMNGTGGGAKAVGGATIYLQRSDSPVELPASEKDLVNECTGSGGSLPHQAPTLLPTRTGFGTAADRIGTRPCTSGNVTSTRGAAVGGGSPDSPTSFSALTGPAATALSDDGKRIFFSSPDPLGDSVAAACTTATGNFTNCPTQLFVRQYDGQGRPVVRWVSRSRSQPASEGAWSGAMIADQRIALLGRGTAFEGASRDGRYIYFRTDAPLVPDDPNGGKSIVDGQAVGSSYDLYRYELPASLDADPDAGSLLRISGGPDGAADSGVGIGSGQDAGKGSALRHLSDDGQRAYFLTASPIPGAVNAPPAGGSTTPGGVAGNSTTRNLYLFDGHAEGADRFRFITRLPFELSAGLESDSNVSACASSVEKQGLQTFVGNDQRVVTPANCFRGSADGTVVAFFTDARLTGDDLDDAGDIYLYQQDEHELTRVSAPRTPEATPYTCSGEFNSGSGVLCNATFGGSVGYFGSGGEHAAGEAEYARGWTGVRHNNIAVGADGRVSVFFESQTQLTSDDSNGDFMDVYEWRDGQLSLVSPGISQDDAWYSGSSVDGSSVFFLTSQRIDPRELDDADGDIYVARVGGGFPYVAPPEACDVLALGCESEALPAPRLRGNATSIWRSSGNVSPSRRTTIIRRCKSLQRGARKARARAGHLRRRARRSRGGRRSRAFVRRARSARRQAGRLAKRSKRCRVRARGLR